VDLRVLLPTRHAQNLYRAFIPLTQSYNFEFWFEACLAYAFGALAERNEIKREFVHRRKTCCYVASSTGEFMVRAFHSTWRLQMGERMFAGVDNMCGISLRRGHTLLLKLARGRMVAACLVSLRIVIVCATVMIVFEWSGPLFIESFVVCCVLCILSQSLIVWPPLPYSVPYRSLRIHLP